MRNQQSVHCKSNFDFPRNLGLSNISNIIKASDSDVSNLNNTLSGVMPEEHVKKQNFLLPSKIYGNNEIKRV